MLTGWQTAYHRTIDIEEFAGRDRSLGSHSGPIGEIVLYDDGEKDGSTVHFDMSKDDGSIRRRIELRLTVELLHGDHRADPQEKALIVEEAAFHADSETKPASPGLTATTNGEMNSRLSTRIDIIFVPDHEPWDRGFARMGIFSHVLQQPEYRELQVFVEWLFGSRADVWRALDHQTGFAENQCEVLCSQKSVLS